jgi:hypothetical protein
MGIGIFVLAGALVVLVVALVLLVAGKGAVRWIGLLIVVLVGAGAGTLILGATAVRTAGTPSLQRPVERGGALLTLSGQASGMGGLGSLTTSLDERLDRAGLRGDDTALFGGGGGEEHYWFQSRMFGNSGTLEYVREFSVSDAATTPALRSAIQSALFEALGDEDSHGLEGLTVELTVWHGQAEAPEAWVLEATESQVSWEPGGWLPVVEATSGAVPADAEGANEAHGANEVNDAPATAGSGGR